MSAEQTTTTPRGGESAGKLDLQEVASWDGDRLVFHSSAVDLLRRKALSPSTAKAMSGCTARWAGERLMPRGTDPFSPAELGTSVHEVLEDLYLKPYYMRSKDEAMRILDVHQFKKWPANDPTTVAKRGEWHGLVHRYMSGLWLTEDPRLVRVKGVEQGFEETTTVEGIPFVGFIDRTDYIKDEETGEEGVKLVDYKSGKVPKDIGRFGDDHGDQMRLYNEAYFNETGERPLKATLIYTQHGKSRDAPLSKPAMSKTLTSFRKAWVDLKRYEETAAFSTQVGPLCGWCPLVNTCPVARAAGKVDRTGNALPEGNFKIPVMRVLRTEVAVPQNFHFDDDPFGDASATAPSPSELAEIFSETSQTVHEETPPAHMSGENPDPSNTQMTAAASAEGASMTNAPIFSEDKPYYELSGGLLNGTAYASTAVFGTVSLAYEELNKANVPLSKDALDGLSQTFAQIVRGVQAEVAGSTSWQHGINTRLRGLLRSFIEVNPLPFGGDAAAWDAWVALSRKHIKTLAMASHRLYEADPVESPWHALANTRPQAVNG